MDSIGAYDTIRDADLRAYGFLPPNKGVAIMPEAQGMYQSLGIPANYVPSATACPQSRPVKTWPMRVPMFGHEAFSAEYLDAGPAPMPAVPTAATGTPAAPMTPIAVPSTASAAHTATVPVAPGASPLTPLGTAKAAAAAPVNTPSYAASKTVTINPMTIDVTTLMCVLFFIVILIVALVFSWVVSGLRDDIKNLRTSVGVPAT